MLFAVVRVVTAICVIVLSYLCLNQWIPEDFSLKSLIISPLPLSLSSKPELHVTGLVLARGGSKGIHKKNIVELNGMPLIGWALYAMLESEAFYSVWVSTDSSEIKDWVSQAFPAVRIHRRAAYTATDEATSIVAVQEFLSYHPEFKAVGLVQATSPFIEPSLFKKAQSLILGEQCDSAFSATRSHSLRWKAVGNESVGISVPLNFNPCKRPRRQDWTGEMVENGMFYFATRELLMTENVFQGKRTCYVEVPSRDSLQIDTIEDLQLAEFFMTKRNIKPPLQKFKES